MEKGVDFLGCDNKMNKDDRDELIYDWVRYFSPGYLYGNEDIDETDIVFRVLKPNIKWTDHLLPDEQEFYDGLSMVDKLDVDMSCDPINNINKRIKEHSKPLPRFMRWLRSLIK